MEVERVVVRLVADASQYNRTVEGIKSKLVSEIGKLTAAKLPDPFAGMANVMQKSVARMSHAMDDLNRKMETTRRLFNARQGAMARDFAARQAFQQQIFGMQQSQLFATPADKRAAIFQARQAEAARRFQVQQNAAKVAMNAQRVMATRAAQSRLDLFNTLRAMDPVGGSGGGSGRAGGGVSSGVGKAEEHHTNIGFGWLARQTARSLVLAYAMRQIAETVAVPLKLAAGFDDAAVSLGVMTGSAERGLRVLTELQQVAVDTPFKFSELADTTKQLRAFGIETEQLVPTVKVLADVAAGTGTDINNIALAFGQVKTAGRLMGQELRQFTNAGVPMIENLAAVLGKRESEIPGLVRSGQVSYGNVVDAFNRMTGTGGSFSGLAKARTEQSFGGQARAAAERFELVGMALGKAAVEGLRLGSVLESISAGLDRLRGSNVSGWFENFRAVLVLAGRGGDFLGEKLSAFVDWLTDSKTALGSVVNGMIKFVGEMGRVAAGVLAVAAAVKVLQYTVGAATLVVRGLSAALKAVAVVATVGGSVSAFFGALSTLAGLAMPLLAVAGAVAAVVLGLKALGAYDAVFSGWGKTFEDMGKTFATAWAGIVGAIKGNDMPLAVSILSAGVEAAWSVMLSKLKMKWEEFEGAIGNAAGGAGATIRKGIVQFRGGVGGTFDELFNRNYAPGAARDDWNNWFRAEQARIDEERAGISAANKGTTDQRLQDIQNKALGDLAAKTRRLNYLAMLGEFSSPDIRRMAGPVSWEKVRRFAGNVEASGFDSTGFFTRTTPSWVDVMERKGPWRNVGPAGNAYGVRGRLDELRDAAMVASRALHSEISEVNAGRGNRASLPALSAAAAKAVENLTKFEDAIKNLGKAAEGMARVIEVRPEVLTRANEINKDMTEGKFLLPFDKFQKEMSLAEEAYLGPGVRMGGLGGLFRRAWRIGSKIDQAAYGEWTLSAFQDLQRFSAPFQNRYAPALLRGTGEEANVIAQAQSQQLSVAQETLRTMTASKAIQEQMLSVQTQTKQAIEQFTKPGSNEASVQKGIND